MAQKAKTKIVGATAEKGGQTASLTKPQPTTTKSIATDAKAKATAPRIFTDAERALFRSKEDTIGSGQGVFLNLGEALHAIKEGGLHEISHPGLTFEDYCWKRWGFGLAYAYRLITAYLCVKHLKDTLTPNKVTVFPVNEAQVRPMTSLEPEMQVAVWTKVLEQANGQTITAKLVEESVGKGSTSDDVDGTKAEPTDAKKEKEKAKKNDRKLDQILKALEKFKATPAEKLSIELLQKIIAKIEEIVSEAKD